MSEEKKNYLFSYEENERLNGEIEAILAENISLSAKKLRLKALRKTVREPISKSHVEYYLNKLSQKRHSMVQHFIGAVVTAVYFLFTLMRIFWYYNPGENPFPETNYTISDFIVFLYIIPIIIIIRYIVKRFLYLFKKRA